MGRSLAAARRHRGLSQAQLAARLKVGHSYIARAETGRSNLTVAQLARFAAALPADLTIAFDVAATEHVR